MYEAGFCTKLGLYVPVAEYLIRVVVVVSTPALAWTMAPGAYAATHMPKAYMY